eukprot:TRINITY_DN11251_c0_g2_i1.p1 TRINITY_DN11251_c0_g2~~TRINITY_DN11251_c0_g2_i1.p1  ORF type:complete len:283 (-),score=51.04 TRINITY_DN11251_c0_g2_i1:128-976(-)
MAMRRGSFRSSFALRSGVLLCVALLSCTQLERLFGRNTSEASGHGGLGLRTSPTAALIGSDSEGPVMRSEQTAPARLLMQHVLRWPERMAERWLGPVNFDRATLRIDAMDTYALCSAVMLQVLVGLYGATQDPEDDDDKDAESGGQQAAYGWYRWYRLTPDRANFEAQMACLMVATLCACFTMVLFLLNKVYSCSAIGMWKDVAYMNFQYHTAAQRKLAFWSLIVAVFFFTCSFSLSLYDRYKSRRGLALCGLSFVIGLVMLLSLKDLMDQANKHVFESYPY